MSGFGARSKRQSFNDSFQNLSTFALVLSTHSQNRTPERFPLLTEGIRMKIQSLGHVVIKVRNQQRAEAFYNGLLEIPTVARLASPVMTFFTLGNHHDFAIAAVGDDAPDAPANSPGRFHAAFKIGSRIDDSVRRSCSSKRRGSTLRHTITRLPNPSTSKIPIAIRSSSTLIHRTSGSRGPMPSRRGSHSISSVILVKASNRRRRQPQLSSW